MEKIYFEEKVNAISVLGRVMDRKNLVEKNQRARKGKRLTDDRKCTSFLS